MPLKTAQRQQEFLKRRLLHQLPMNQIVFPNKFIDQTGFTPTKKTFANLRITMDEK
jgi:hypothetical protein